MITPLAGAYEWADDVGARIYSVQLIESFPRCQASDLPGNKETQVHSQWLMAMTNINGLRYNIFKIYLYISI